MVHRTSGVTLTKSQGRTRDGGLGLAIREEVRVDEIVDHRLAGGIDFGELNAHADTAIAPGDASSGADVALGSRHPASHLDVRVRVERARRANGDAAATQVKRERRRNRVAEAVLDR